MPHGFCYFWNPGLVWLHVVADSLIALSYYTIPVALFWLVRKRRDVPFSWMFVLFGVFIIACGTTHLMEVWNIWHADYWLDGAIKAITAAASVPTAVLSIMLLPKATQLPNLSEWMKANARLEDEIKARRETELHLRVSEAAYREQAELLDLSHDAIFVRDMNRTITYWNRACERIYGWRSEEALGRRTAEVLSTNFPKPLTEIETDVVQKGVWEGELTQRRRDGSEVTVSSRWALRRDAAGNPQAILESNRDITARVREERKFRNLLEAAPDSIVIVDHRGLIHLVNAQTEKLFGYSREELIGQPVEMLMPRRFQASHERHREIYSASPRTRAMGQGLDLYGLRKDGTEFPVEISLSPLETSEGTLVSSAIRDISDRRRADEKIHALNSQLNQKLTELAASNRELEAFSYSVSHDLRAPLRHIDGFARILQEEHAHELSQEGQRHLDCILGAVTHMGRLIDDLLGLARISRKELVRQHLDLNQIVRQALSELPVEEQKRRSWSAEVSVCQSFVQCGEIHAHAPPCRHRSGELWRAGFAYFLRP
jgi:PAS domain S-box-containing protein